MPIENIKKPTLKQFKQRIIELSELDRAEYEYISKEEAKKLGCGVVKLDKAVDEARKHIKSKKIEAKNKQQRTFIDDEWVNELITKTDNEGVERILWRVFNAELILKNDAEYQDRITMDLFANQIYLDDHKWEDTDTSRLKTYFEKNWFSSLVPTDGINEAVELIAKFNGCHPVKDYLDDLKWDGIERIPEFFTNYCHSPDWNKHQNYLKGVAKSLFISAVSRIFNAGCKVDTMVILESGQGGKKTELILALFGFKYHLEIIEKVGSKDFYQSLRGVWCAEFGELAEFSKADTNKVKQVITQRHDSYRASYGRFSKTYPRQCIFIGTTNKDEYLTDETGGRRFLPVQCGETIDINSVKQERDQLWAEAVYKYLNIGNEEWWDIQDAKEHQDMRQHHDVWEGLVADYLTVRETVDIPEILEKAIFIAPDKQEQRYKGRLGKILARLGWKKDTRSQTRPRMYIKKAM
jgi:putative DNA primase/helicase